MSWNYRIVQYRDSNGFGLHEVYYDDEGQPWSMTQDPIGFSCDETEGKEGVISSMCMALTDALNKPLMDEYEEGKWPGTVRHEKNSICR